ncbi:MAG: rane protease FtsH catalytic subunit [Planctomycetaceae bacterium]|nr:rane protease FtsH catalytic subunit [Planctomycetaceae bacterium]
MSSTENPEFQSESPKPAAYVPPPPMPGWFKYGVPLALLIWLVWFILFSPPNSEEVSYSFFWQQVKADNVTKLIFNGSFLGGDWVEPPNDPEAKTETKLPKLFSTNIPKVEDKRLLEQLDQHKIKYKVVNTEPSAWFVFFVYTAITVMVGGTILFMFLRRSSDPLGGSGMFGNIARSPARRFEPSSNSKSYKDVAGMENAKRELSEVVDFLKDPAYFQRLGASIPKGVLLMGPPGTGKTLLARATAGEAGVAFYSINGSEFIQMFVGVGASRVRDLFRTAKENAPCLIFIDEIDAVGRMRGAGYGGGNDEREQTLNQILSEMDGFQQTDAIIVLAATNRPDVLDPALLRPGRFDRHVTVDRPTRDGRRDILKVHSRKVPLADNVDLGSIAASTIGFSGADLKNLVNEAAIHATCKGKNWVEAEDFEAARDKVLMGPKREEVLSPHEREMTAYHEAGHALLAWRLSEVDIVHKVTIIPRGQALGVTQLMPNEENHSVGEKRLHARLAFTMGGRAAEKMVFDEFTAGAESDLKQATSLARRMVGHWGMSEVIGPVSFRQQEENPFLGKELHDSREFSEETAKVIDQEVQKFLVKAHDRALEVLQQNRAQLDQLARALVEKESLGQEEMTVILGPPVAKPLSKTS